MSIAKVAFVHDWLVSYRGGERVLESLCELYPQAPIFTLFYDPAAMPASWRNRDIRTPASLRPRIKLRKFFLPVLPACIESLPTFEFDLLISSSSALAKGALAGPSARHLCYIHSPMRYIWDQRDSYFAALAKIPGSSMLLHLASSRLRIWDTVSAARVDQFVANSNFVRDRVQRYYRRDAEVVHPPVAVDDYASAAAADPVKEGYWLVAGAMVSYKRIDLAIEAWAQVGGRLVIAGAGPMLSALKAQVGGRAGCDFVVAPDGPTWSRLLRRAKALIFPGVEDFGIVPVEAMAAGTPVIAFRAGGAQDFLIPGIGGVFFEQASVQALVQAMKNFDSSRFERGALLESAQRFSPQNFQIAMAQQIQGLGSNLPRPIVPNH